MLKSISWKYNPNRYISGDKAFIITIVDTDFTHTAIANNYWELIVQEYGKKNLNIAANLARAIIQGQNRSMNESKELASKYTGGIYDEEIEKYLLLV
jgi:hypothetical protein